MRDEERLEWEPGGIMLCVCLSLSISARVAPKRPPAGGAIIHIIFLSAPASARLSAALCLANGEFHYLTYLVH